MNIETYPTRGKLAAAIAVAVAVYAVIAYAVFAAPPIQHEVQPCGVTWDPPLLGEPEAYRVYWGRTSREYTNHVLTTNLVATVEINATGVWYVAATAIADGLESDYSAELEIPIVRIDPPGNVRIVVIIK